MQNIWLHVLCRISQNCIKKWLPWDIGYLRSILLSGKFPLLAWKVSSNDFLLEYRFASWKFNAELGNLKCCCGSFAKFWALYVMGRSWCKFQNATIFSQFYYIMHLITEKCNYIFHVNCYQRKLKVEKNEVSCKFHKSHRKKALFPEWIAHEWKNVFFTAFPRARKNVESHGALDSWGLSVYQWCRISWIC